MRSPTAASRDESGFPPLSPLDFKVLSRIEVVIAARVVDSE